MQKNLSALFGSDTRVHILETLFSDVSRDWSLTELAGAAGVDVGGAHRELANLASVGVLVINESSGKPSYSINSSSRLYAGLRELFNENSTGRILFCLEDMPDASPLLFYSYQNVLWINETLGDSRISGRLSYTVSLYDDKQCGIYYDRKEYYSLEKEVLGKLLEDPNWGLQDSEKVIALNRVLNQISDEVSELNFTSLSGPQLADRFETHYEIYRRAHTPGWVQNLADMPDMLFSKYLLGLLKERARKGVKSSPSEAFSKLTTPMEASSIAMEYIDLLRLLEEIRADDRLWNLFSSMEARHILEKVSGTQIGRDIARHAKKHGWLGHGYLGNDWGPEIFIDRLASLCRQKMNPRKSIEEEERKSADLRANQEMLEEEFSLTEPERRLFKVARSFVYAKGFRKDAMIRAFSRLEPLYAEIARRTFISSREVRFCFPSEVRKLLSGSMDMSLLSKRRDCGLLESGLHGEKHFQGETARKQFKTYSLESLAEEQVTTIQGMCACPGKHRGRVRIVNTVGDMAKLQKGDVLVSIATMPELVPAMKKAGSIVTDAGGITCHAAIVSRELNIPCIVGTKNASKVLMDGYLVDVDATHGMIRIIER